MNESDLKDILSALRHGINFVATTTPDDLPAVRPFGPAIEHDGAIYLFTSNKKSVYAQILNNPTIQIAASLGDSDWFRLTARAIPAPDPAILQAFLDDDPGLAEIASIDDGHSTPLKLEIIHAAFITDDQPTRTITP